jgi:hypothetical protein
VCIGICGPVVGHEAAVTAQAQTVRANFFADEEISFTLELTATQAVDGLASWQLMMQHRTLMRGDARVKITPRKLASVSFPLRMPHLNQGVIEKIVLAVGFSQAGDAGSATIFEQDLWVFASDPFVDRTQWLEELGLQLFDPPGQTAQVFESAEIPFRRIHTTAALDAIEEGIVVVGEGISLRKRATLAETLLSLAATGRDVLWFAPEEGDFEFPGGEDFPGITPKQLLLSGSNMIEKLDKRLDSNTWADPEQAKSVGLQLVARRNRAYLEISSSNQGWTWLQTDFGEPGGQMILSGFCIADCWDLSPTPRFLLARLLEQFDNPDQPSEETP